jgi:hypothetical protein
MAGISGGRANDERVKCLRIFSDGDGETHLEDIDITLQPKKLFKDTPPLGLTENLSASWYNICYVPKGTGETDWHNPPQRLLVLWLTGEVEFETSDGNIRRLPADSIARIPAGDVRKTSKIGRPAGWGTETFCALPWLGQRPCRVFAPPAF